MSYDKNSFLAGIAVGRNMKSWPDMRSIFLLDYIESDVDSFINLQYSVSQYSKVEMDCFIYTENSTYATMFGTRDGNYTRAFLMHSSEETGPGLTIQYSSLDYRTHIDISGIRVTVTLEKNLTTYTFRGGSTVSLPFTAGTSITTLPLYICNLNEAGHVYGPSTWAHMKIYGMTITDSRRPNTPDSILIPVKKRDAPGAGMLYDIRRQMLFPSETAHAFIPGPVVT